MNSYIDTTPRQKMNDSTLPEQQYIRRDKLRHNEEEENSNQSAFDAFSGSSSNSELLKNSVLCRKSNSTASTTVTFYHFELHVLMFLITILSCSSFIHMYFYSKLALMLLALVVYAVGFHLNRIYECLAESIEEQVRLSFLKAQIFIQMFFYVMFLHLIDRRVILVKIFCS
jgi:hypothetical protein